MKKAFVMAGIIMSMSMFGCSKSQSTPAPETANDVQAPVAAAATCNSGATSEAMTAASWADANNAFGLQLLAQSDPSKSFVASPYSIERCLGMVLEGACGDTASGMRNALSLSDAANTSVAGGEVEKLLLANNPEEVAINVDNRVWVDKTTELLATYTSSLKSAYSADLLPVDFVNAADSARMAINQSVSDSTRGKISEILPAGSVNSSTKLVLTNAIYFKAPWQHAFNVEKTDMQDFTGVTGVNQVDMMHAHESMSYTETDDYAAIDLNFVGGKFAFLVVLPTVKDGENVMDALGRVEKSLTAESMRNIHDEMQDVKVKLSLPKFRVDAGMQMKPLLQKLGMTAAFDKTADFSGMTGDNSLAIDDVYHKAFIEVAEEGAEAAAATGTIMKLRIMRPIPNDIVFNVDHPFIYAIVDRESSAALFIGRVTNL